MFMHLDVNSKVYPIKDGQKFSMALTSTLNLDGTPDTGYFTPVNLFIYFYIACNNSLLIVIGMVYHYEKMCLLDMEC